MSAAVYYNRGIRMDATWRSDFRVFKQWALANFYKEGLVIDRKNNDGDYEPSNCRWRTRIQNARNKRNNHMLTAFGETKCLSEWAEDTRCEASRGLIGVRLKLGMTPERAITKPLPKSRRHG